MFMSLVRDFSLCSVKLAVLKSIASFNEVEFLCDINFKEMDPSLQLTSVWYPLCKYLINSPLFATC